MAKISPNQREFAKMVANGHTSKESAIKCGFSAGHGHNLLQGSVAPQVKELINELKSKQYAIFQEAAEKAAEKAAADNMDNLTSAALKTKAQIIAKLQALAQKAEDGEKPDLNLVMKCIVEEGKLMGYYVVKTETLTNVPKKRKRDLSKLSLSQLKQLKEIDKDSLIEEE